MQNKNINDYITREELKNLGANDKFFEVLDNEKLLIKGKCTIVNLLDILYELHYQRVSNELRVKLYEAGILKYNFFNS